VGRASWEEKRGNSQKSGISGLRSGKFAQAGSPAHWSRLLLIRCSRANLPGIPSMCRLALRPDWSRDTRTSTRRHRASAGTIHGATDQLARPSSHMLVCSSVHELMTAPLNPPGPSRKAWPPKGCTSIQGSASAIAVRTCGQSSTVSAGSTRSPDRNGNRLTFRQARRRPPATAPLTSATPTWSPVLIELRGLVVRELQIISIVAGSWTGKSPLHSMPPIVVVPTHAFVMTKLSPSSTWFHIRRT
jgi:hypothetical protein